LLIGALKRSGVEHHLPTAAGHAILCRELSLEIEERLRKETLPAIDADDVGVHLEAIERKRQRLLAHTALGSFLAERG
jgi:hypothetical protein